ncbi:MAG: hypothetical protein HC915_03515 [Anaerolineae bacterium]|nr:hypothetical protein [Anaerolineae bacterium]
MKDPQPLRNYVYHRLSDYVYLNTSTRWNEEVTISGEDGLFEVFSVYDEDLVIWRSFEKDEIPAIMAVFRRAARRNKPGGRAQARALAIVELLQDLLKA